MMPATIHQKTALDTAQDAIDALCSQYRRTPSMEERCDQIKEFVKLTLMSVQQLISEEDCDGTILNIKPSLDEIDEAFALAIEAEDMREGLAHPAFTQRGHGTISHRQQGIGR